jgi:hypothetical protein
MQRAIGATAVLLCCVAGAPAAAVQPRITADEIGGTVRSPRGAEAGVWVIAETHDFATRFAKIVVTDDNGRYLIPELPRAKYSVWVRGYGLSDSVAVDATPGRHLDLAAVVAPDAAAAAKIYPAAYWFAMMKIPEDAQVGAVPGRRNGYLMWMKNMGCVGCHQLGNLATRTIPKSLGTFKSSQEAWVRRLQSGQAGSQMINIAQGVLAGIPIHYLADWTDRIEGGELPAAAPTRPSGIERNIVATVRDWSDAKAYLHDLSGTDRRHPTVNGHGLIYGAPELSTDDFPVLDPQHNLSSTFKATVRDANTPTTHDDPVLGASPYWGEERIWASQANAHNPMLDESGRVWYTARIRASDNPSFCKQGSSHPSARTFPLNTSERQLAVYEPKSRKYIYVDTCFSTHHLQFAEDATDTLWTSGAREVIGWFDTKKFDQTGDAAASQGWAPVVLDLNGNGKLDAWTEPGQPADPSSISDWRSAFTRSCRIRRTAACGVRWRSGILARLSASIREPGSARSTMCRRPVLVCAARTSTATAWSGYPWRAVIWANSTGANAWGRSTARPRRAITVRKGGASIACRDRDSWTCRK